MPMKRPTAAAALLLLLPAACGQGGEDFTVTVDRPEAKVMPAFAVLTPDPQLGQLIPGIRVNRDKPDAHTVVYTIPAKNLEPVTIRLAFGPGETVNQTAIHATIDIPPVPAALPGNKVLSEAKVAEQLQKLLIGAGRKLARGQPVEREQAELGLLLSAVAIAADPAKTRMAMEIAKNPDWYRGEAELIARAFGERPAGAPQSDPQLSASLNDWRERARMEAAAAPLEQASGTAPRGYDPSN